MCNAISFNSRRTRIEPQYDLKDRYPMKRRPTA